MLFETLSKDIINYTHLASLRRSNHTVILNTADSCLIHFIDSNIYIAESLATDLSQFIQTIRDYSPALLETTNTSLYEILRKDYHTSYACYQYSFISNETDDSCLTTLAYADLPFVKSTYEDSHYIEQLFEHNQIFGYYVNSTLIGYIAMHIDGTLGALYVKPEYRCNGYGSRIVNAAVASFHDPLLYSQVVEDNVPSIHLHESVHAVASAEKIYWMYNTGFSYPNPTRHLE